MPTSPSAGAFAPLRQPVFRSLWIANLATTPACDAEHRRRLAHVASLAPSPLMVSLVQAAAMLPVFLFALPGGALADILDRRLTLIAASSGFAAHQRVLEAVDSNATRPAITI